MSKFVVRLPAYRQGKSSRLICYPWNTLIGKKILVAPLDWGLGHATRCIPIVRELLQAGLEVSLAADGTGEKILREAFPELEFIPLRGYHLSYSRYLPAWFKIILQLPKILSAVRREHKALDKIIDEHKIGIVISDNRFGLWSKRATTVYVTHQLMIKCPRGLKFVEPLLHAWHKSIINKYDYCWIPDVAGEKNLSGDLSHKYPLPCNAEFIGPLSRFEGGKKHAVENDLCIILSGPEPSRTAMEKKVFSLLKNYKGKCIVILGSPGHDHPASTDTIKVYSHLKSDEFEKAVLSSRFIICRSGYSSIMDLVALKKNALLIPTPGQTEQEYLATYLSEQKKFSFRLQNDFALADIALENFSSETVLLENDHLKKSILGVIGSSQNNLA